MDFVYEVVTRREFDDGFVSDQFVRWDGVSSSFEEIKQNILYVEKHKVVALRQRLVLDSGAEVDIPIFGTLHILPDRTGVLVIFEKEPSRLGVSHAPWFFSFPNNAAIYNVDGSLRHQLCNPYGKNSYIGAIHSGAMPDHPDKLGVLIGTVGHEPEWLYLVDPNSPQLISTGKWIRY
jgi:hypothetical protein